MKFAFCVEDTYDRGLFTALLSRLVGSSVESDLTL